MCKYNYVDGIVASKSTRILAGFVVPYENYTDQKEK